MTGASVTPKEAIAESATGKTRGAAPDGGDPARHETWGRVCDRFRGEYGDHAFQTWIDQLGYRGVDAGTVELTAPTKFVRDWIQRQYAARLKDFFLGEDPKVRDVQIRLRSQSENAVSVKRPSSAGQAATPTSGPGREDGAQALDARYRFENFVVGKSNEFAHAACQRLAYADEITFNPLFLHGGVGLGKTHLMHAIAWEVTQRDPSKKVVYISAERFMYEFVSAVRFKDTHAFKQKYRNVDLLMVDDVQFLAQKESTQDEFFHTFNALIDNRCQVVITADRSPTDLEGIEERIISRFGWGLVADIHATDYELRLGILQSKAEREEGAPVPMDLLEFLAAKITSNVRELEGALNRVIAYATLVGRPITMDMARDVLQDLLRANDRKLTIDEIQKSVSDYYNIRPNEMVSERRSRAVARPRQVAMYLAKQLTSKSLPDIGRRFGGRDHTTVMYAVKKIEDLRRTDAHLDEDVTRLIRLLQG